MEILLLQPPGKGSKRREVGFQHNGVTRGIEFKGREVVRPGDYNSDAGLAAQPTVASLTKVYGWPRMGAPFKRRRAYNIKGRIRTGTARP